ncbi:type II secretion system protein GspM [Porticoccus sp. W117]|uniref:type II secretion system protein GspM n=1 Tax=Porticoccus sp. W117 TaxID=3054777 RepID=UPI0025945499|nr:type II secretion system protein GspM [Porticoccus sp. W117]MDM3870900.1 type II secretion system protein GspM [Porticoccus sp. W117]
MNELSAKFDALQQREKILITAIIIALVYALVEFTLLKPADDEHSKLTGQLDANSKSLANNQEQLAQLQASAAGSNGSQGPQLQVLQQQIDALRAELATLAGGLADAQQLPRILEDVLVKTGKLSLLKLQALPVEELQLSATDGSGDLVSAGVYKHAVSLQLQGRYFEVVDYLQALEQLPWGLRWEHLNYRADSYPNAKVTLQVYTLTTEEGLFGEQ